MSDIQQYSREWFVNHGNYSQKAAMKRNEYERLILNEGVKPEDVKYNKELF